MIKQDVMCLLPIMSSQFLLNCLGSLVHVRLVLHLSKTVVKSVLECLIWKKMRIAWHPFSELLQNATKVIVSI